MEQVLALAATEDRRDDATEAAHRSLSTEADAETVDCASMSLSAGEAHCLLPYDASGCLGFFKIAARRKSFFSARLIAPHVVGPSDSRAALAAAFHACLCCKSEALFGRVAARSTPRVSEAADCVETALPAELPLLSAPSRGV